ncbi:MAG: peptide ABC transporter substrate-binding protein, partial [Burkholderiales bacterium]
MRNIAAAVAVASALAALLVVGGCAEVWNDPYPGADRGRNILYTSFIDRPKTLDPARSYTSDEWGFIQQIYEPPLQYQYLKRPYELIPQSALEVPKPRLLDSTGRELPGDALANQVAISEYLIRIRPGIMYQPHPAFAEDAQGRPLYLDLSGSTIRDKYALSDFPQTGTRELVAEDFVYEIKRLAHPRVVSPIFGHMSTYIVGLKELGAALKAANDRMV